MVSDFGERGCAMQAGESQVLLLFKKGGSFHIPSPHDGDGELHIAFAIPATELERWEAWLEENGIAIEEKRTSSSLARVATTDSRSSNTVRNLCRTSGAAPAASQRAHKR
jgi:hypothetical protein